MEKKFKLKLSGPGLDLDTAITELQAKTIFNIAFAPASPSAADGAGASELLTTPLVLPAGAAPSPRDFIATKNPMTEQERITCLAYYLYKFRKLEKFSAKELKDINGAAAQPMFNNISYTARDAATTGYLASVGGGKKMLAMLGERVVDAMPNREKVAEVLKKYGRKNRRRATTGKAK
ncbi:MAG: hypothetical protein WA373_04840 [Burkholderiales bacterium]